MGRRIVPAAEAAFLAGLGKGSPSIEALVAADYRRSAHLVERSADLDLGFVDASAVAVAERLRIDTVATVNRRDFGVVRPSHGQAFTLVP